MASKESIRLWKVQLANAVVIRTMSLGEGCEVAKMEASQLLQTYQIRKAGYDDGLFKSF